MKLDTQWRDQFTFGDLARGKGYYYDGHVKALRQVEDGWEARVVGYDTYHVFVPSESQPLSSMYCDCPRFENGYNCKHLAATCLTIEKSAASGTTTASTNEGADLDELVASVSEDDVRAFLLDTLRANEPLAIRFRQKYGALSVEVAKRTLSQAVDLAMRTHSNGGFIDWRASHGFARAYNSAIASAIEPFIERGELAGALAMSIEALRCLQHVEIDDSDGFYSDAISDVIHWWRDLLGKGDAAFAHELFDAVSAFTLSLPEGETEAEIFGYAADDAESFLLNEFADRAEFSGRILAMASGHIELAEARCRNAQHELAKAGQALENANAKPRKKQGYYASGSTWNLERNMRAWSFSFDSARHELAKWTLVRLRTLKASGVAEDKLRAEAGEIIIEEEPCKFFLQMARERNDAEAMRELLTSCKEAQAARKDGSYPLWVSAELVKLLGDDVPALRDELLHLLDNSKRFDAPESTESLWVKLRATYDSCEWARQRKRILAKLEDPNVQRDCLAAEGMYDVLMADAEKSGLGACGNHEAELVKHYPERMLALHLKAVKPNVTNPGNSRKSYAYLADRLRKVRTLPGGDAEVSRIVASLRQRYPNRPALLDELSRV